MTRLVSMILFLMQHYVNFGVFKRIERLVYQPYGPKMCLELSQDLGEPFSFRVDDFSCRLDRKRAFDNRNVSNEEFFCDTEFLCRTIRPFPDKDNTMMNDRNNASKISRKYICQHSQKVVGVERDQVNFNSTLHQACKEGDLCVVQYILSEGLADINSLGNLGRTPVMVAARNRHLAVFNFLLQQDCDLSALDELNNTLLHVASLGGNVEIVKALLVNNSFDAGSTGRYGWSPIMISAYKGYRELFDFLVSVNCDLTATDDDGDNLLHLASFGGNTHIVNTLLKQDLFSIECKGRYGRTPLMRAAYKGNRDVFDLLVRKECNLTAVDDNKDNILHLASYGGSVSMVRHILSQHVVSIDSRGEYGRTPLMNAVLSGNTGVFNLLVNNGCDMTVVDEENNNVIHLAGLKGYIPVIKHILSTGLISIDSKGKNGETAVMMAAFKGHFKVVKYLVSKNCNLTVTNNDHKTIFHRACSGGHVNVIKYVINSQNSQKKKKHLRCANDKLQKSLKSCCLPYE